MPRAIVAALAALLIASASCGSQAPAAPSSSTAPSNSDPGLSQAGGGTPPAGYRLVWQDEFDGSTLDASKWNVQSAARRDAVNSPAAIAVSGGTLIITTFTDGGTHVTGFIDTAGKYEPIFGYIEARIRFDSTPGEWGAFWLQSPTMGNPVGNTAVAGTEIDVVEHRAHNAAAADIRDTYVMNVHWDGYGSSHQTSGSTGRPPSGALAGAWHTYGLLWTADAYVFSIDGVEQWRLTSAPSRRSEFIRLTCEVLDKGWAGNIPAGGYGSAASSTTRMLVEWVRVWQAGS